MAVHTNIEKRSVLSKSVLKIKDIQVLMDCGSDKACKIAKEFRKWFQEREGYQLYNGQIPTELFVEFAHINEKRILKYALLGL